MTGTSLGSPVVRHTRHASPVHEPPAAIRATGIIVVLTVVLAIVAIAFALPAARSKPHDVPIGAAGPMAAGSEPGTPPLGRGVADILEQHAPGAFRITYYPGEAALRDAIRNRDVYGGISFGAGHNVAGQATPEGRTLLIATGGSPMVAQMLTQLGNGISQQTGLPLRTEDLAPPTADDPRGAGLVASALPITLAGLLPAVALVLLFKREVWTRFTAAVVFAAVAGTGIAALMRYVFGSIDRNVWASRPGSPSGCWPLGCRCWVLVRCSAASALPSARCLRCCWATRCPASPAHRRCCQPAGAPSVSGCRRAPTRRCCDRPHFSTVAERRPRSRC